MVMLIMEQYFKLDMDTIRAEFQELLHQCQDIAEIEDMLITWYPTIPRSLTYIENQVFVSDIKEYLRSLNFSTTYLFHEAGVYNQSYDYDGAFFYAENALAEAVKGVFEHRLLELNIIQHNICPLCASKETGPSFEPQATGYVYMTCANCNYRWSEVI